MSIRIRLKGVARFIFENIKDSEIKEEFYYKVNIAIWRYYNNDMERLDKEIKSLYNIYNNHYLKNKSVTFWV